MKLHPDEFRSHVESMMNSKQKAQLEMWVGHGLLIYVNFQELIDIWDEEYEDRFHALWLFQIVSRGRQMPCPRLD